MNPFGSGVRIVDRRRVNFTDIDKHVALQDGDEHTKLIARLPLPSIKQLVDSSVAKGDFGAADRARAAAEMRRSGAPPELCGKGQLHEVCSFDPRTGRAETHYFGDPKVWREQFEHPGTPGTFMPAKSFERHTGEVTISGTETLIARSPGGTERIVHLKPTGQ